MACRVRRIESILSSNSYLTHSCDAEHHRVVLVLDTVMRISNYNNMLDQLAPPSDSQYISSLVLSTSSVVGEHMSTALFPHDPQASRILPSEDTSPLCRKKRKKKQGNCVSFAIDLDENIVKQYTMGEDRLSLTREELADKWLSPIELRNIHQDASRTATDCRAKYAGDSFRDTIDQLFNVVSQESSLIKSGSSQHAKMYTPNQCRQGCRGLERQVYTSIRNHGHRYTKAILKVQSKLPADIKPEMKARLLRARSLQLSKPSRLLAKLLAHGDTLEVRGFFVQEQ